MPFDHLSGISCRFQRLSQSCGQVAYVLLTRSPLTLKKASFPLRPFDLHVLSTPPAFILSQDQTLHLIAHYLLYVSVRINSNSFELTLGFLFSFQRSSASPLSRSAFSFYTTTYSKSTLFSHFFTLFSALFFPMKKEEKPPFFLPFFHHFLRLFSSLPGLSSRSPPAAFPRCWRRPDNRFWADHILLSHPRTDGISTS